MVVLDAIAPSFIKKPKLRQEDDGNRLIFECQLKSSPKPEIEWYRGETLLLEDERTHFKINPLEDCNFEVYLDLNDVIESDAGLYKIKAKNKMGEVSASINLNFSQSIISVDNSRQIDGFAPTFVKKPAIRQEDEGKRLFFECCVSADPKPTILWFHDGSQIEESPRHKIIVNKNENLYVASLEIKDVTVEDAGKYKVNAKNELGESNATISLNFDSGADANGFAPSFIEKPRIMPNDSGTLITMKCRSKAKPKPNVTWFKGTEVVKETKKIKIHSSCISEDTYELTLEIKDPGATDGGTYRCYVQNEYGESNANLNLNIEAEPEPEGDAPKFVDKPRIVSENNGKLVIMECKVKSDPKPDICWTHNEKMIHESSQIKTTMEQRGDEYYIKLELHDPKLEDSGLYKCNIKNVLGELNANLTLNIEIVPVIKDKPRIIKILKKRSVIIECTVTSKFEPACTWFKESTEVSQSERHIYHVEQTREGEYAVKLEINQVEETDKGSYKLVAKNEKGQAVSQIVNLIDIPEEERVPTKPTLSRSLKDQKVFESKTFELIITLTQCDRKCKVEWFKGSTIVKETKDVTTTFDGTTARLTFSSAKMEHSATYKVVISNEVGKVESTCNIIVEKEDLKKKKDPEQLKTKIEEKRKSKSGQSERAEQKASEKKMKESKSDSRKGSTIPEDTADQQVLQAAEQLPKLRKTSISSSKEEPKNEEPKPKKKSKPSSKSKFEELPEIPDYERPVLEKFEKPEFALSDFSRDLEIPNKMEKPSLEIKKKQPENAALRKGSTEKKLTEQSTDEDQKKIVIGKGEVPDTKLDDENVVLRPSIIEPEVEKPRIPKIQPPASGEPPAIEVIREKRPSLAPEPPSRRGSLVPPDMGRRPSLIIDEISRALEILNPPPNLDTYCATLLLYTIRSFKTEKKNYV